MGARTQKAVEKILADAALAAVMLVASDIQKAMPDGWRVVLAVGWGMGVYDEQGRSRGGHTPGGLPIPAKLRRALVTAEWLEERHCFGNEQIFKDKVVL